MLNPFRTKARERRVDEYLKSFPDDDPAVQAIIFAADTVNATSPREAAEVLAGWEMSDDEWGRVGPRWERAWSAVIGE